jgi:hypothetical protein
MKQEIAKPNYEEWLKQKVKVTDLFLDTKNIRLDIGVDLSQDALINDLFTNEDAMQVLRSIAINGFFPDEIPVVVKESNKFIVLEGNRRVAAVKALLRPEIVPAKESLIKGILKTSIPVSNEREVVVAPDRDSAMVFLANKHTQNTKRRWRPLRQAYFYKAELERGKTVQNLRDDYPTVDISKFLRLINVHKIAKSMPYDSDTTAKKVHNEKTFPASTIERLYDDKQVRDFLGFDFDGNGEVKINIDKKEFEKGFKKIVEDVVEKNVDSRALNSEKDRKDYLAGFAKENTPDKSKPGKVTTSKDFTETLIVTTKRRNRLAPSGMSFALQCGGVKRMLKELQTIDYHKLPNAAHDLLRSFLECGLKAYFDHCKKTVTPTKGKYVYLDTVLEAFINEMNQAKNTKLSQVASRIKDNSKMTSYSATFLNATNHNPDIFVTPQEVEDAWDAMEPLFNYILAPNKKQNVQNKPQKKS